MRDSGAGDQEVLSASFVCAACTRPAATVQLIPPGLPDPRFSPEPPGVPPGIASIFIEHYRVSIDGGPVTVTHVASQAAQSAVHAADPEALYSLDREFAPFWCPKCRDCYCETHWSLEEIYDEAGWDYTLGTCPRGHRRKLID